MDRRLSPMGTWEIASAASAHRRPARVRSMIARENRSKSRSAESEQSSGWFERLKHCTEVQLEAAESTSCPSKFVSDLPG
jgi:hypothetical protein